MPKDEKTYRIWGKVIEKETGRGIPNLIVKAYDRDLLRDDPLGEHVTDEKGHFEIRYSQEDFKELIFDRSPDIFLTVSDFLGTVIKSTSDKIRQNASRKEGFYIRLPRSTVSHLAQPAFRVLDSPFSGKRRRMKLKVKGIPLEEIAGIGPARARKLKKKGISDAKAFTEASEKDLREILGNLDIKVMKKDAGRLVKGRTSKN